MIGVTVPCRALAEGYAITSFVTSNILQENEPVWLVIYALYFRCSVGRRSVGRENLAREIK
jgi:hypothetical protein